MSIRQFSIRARHLDPDWLEQRWLIPEQSSAGANFSDMDVARAHFIRDLKADFGVNDEGLPGDCRRLVRDKEGNQRSDVLDGRAPGEALVRAQRLDNATIRQSAPIWQPLQ